MADNITITEGTAKAIAADDVSSVWYQRVKLDVGADGLSSAFTGTLAEVSNLVTGTIAKVTNLAGGTVRIDPYPPTTVITYGSLATASGSAFGTLSDASGAGTYTYISGYSMVVSSGTVDAYLGFGTELNGTNVIARGKFIPGGGMARACIPPLRSSGTNSEVCWELAGAGTVYYTINYWKGV